ncbi:MAG: DHH family phosphoesterase [Patescibacteria group bacterium]
MPDLTHDFRRLAEIARKANRILLISHKKPDGDTTGSTTAFFNWLVSEGKHPVMFCVDTPPMTFSYIRNIDRYTSDISVFEKKYDLIISFDSGDLRYAGVEPYMQNLQPGYFLANVDHHKTNAYFGDLNIVALDASSTSEAVYRFFNANDIFIDADMATSMLTGICTDTSNFSNPLTSAQSLSAGSNLIASGARFNDIIRYFWKNQSFDALGVWGLMLSRLNYQPTYDIATSYLTEDELKNMPLVITEQMVNFLAGAVRDVDTVLLLRERNNGTINGSFRSHVRDVSTLAKTLGGGGHKGAAAFAMNGKFEKVEGGVRIV